MNFTRFIGSILGLAALVSLAACGGGSSSGTPSGGGTTPPPPAPTSITAIGSITGFGSVWINGVKYEVEGDTIISIEGEADSVGDDSVLRLGMKVKVKGQDDNGLRTAQSIEYDDDLKGPINNIVSGADPGTGTFEIVGVEVTVDLDTVFDDDIGDNDGVPGIDFGDLEDGMVIEVSGFPTDSGFLATRLDRELDGLGGDPEVGNPDVDGDELKIKGFVEDVDLNQSQITVNSVVFNIDLVNTIFADGLMFNDDLLDVFVEVKADRAGSGWVAVRIEREDDFDDDRSGEFEIEGFLQSVDTDATTNTFTINGMTIPVTDASSLVALVGLRVEIKGSFNADNVLVLREAELEVEDDVRVDDKVQFTPMPGDTSFTTRLGLVITPTGGSRVQDDAADSGDNLTPAVFIERLRAGDRIESRGFENADGTVTWTRVEREELAANDDDIDCELRGPVSTIVGDETSFTFVIQGVTVSTVSVQDDDFKDVNETSIGRAMFFANLFDGVVVEAQSLDLAGSCMAGALDARQVEFED